MINSEIIMEMNNEIKMVNTLRGLAAFLVFMFHCNQKSYLYVAHLPALEYFFSWGHLGVQIFFVISGFIIPFSLYKSKYSILAYFKFLLKRITRVNPPAYAAIFLMLCFYWVPYFLFNKVVAVFDPSVYQFNNIIYNLTFTIPLTKSEWLLQQFWTLAVEFQYYLLIGLIFPLIIKSKKIAILVLLLFVCIPMFTNIGDKHFMFNHAVLFVMGIITFLYKKSILKNLEFYFCLILLVVLGFIQIGYKEALFGVATCLAIAFVNFSNIITEFFGKISYSLYLFHVTFAVYIDLVFRKFFNPASSFIGNASLVSLYLLLIIFLSYLMHVIVERPFIKISSKITYNRN